MHSKQSACLPPPMLGWRMCTTKSSGCGDLIITPQTCAANTLPFNPMIKFCKMYNHPHFYIEWVMGKFSFINLLCLLLKSWTHLFLYIHSTSVLHSSSFCSSWSMVRPQSLGFRSHCPKRKDSRTDWVVERTNHFLSSDFAVLSPCTLLCNLTPDKSLQG